MVTGGVLNTYFQHDDARFVSSKKYQVCHNLNLMFKRKMIKVINDDRRRRTGTKRKERADEEDNGDVLTEVHHKKTRSERERQIFFATVYRWEEI